MLAFNPDARPAQPVRWKDPEVAADTGGAIRGATIDLWFPTTAQANAWGRRSVTVVLH